LILDNKQKKLFKDSFLFKENTYSILDEELEESDYLSLNENTGVKKVSNDFLPPIKPLKALYINL